MGERSILIRRCYGSPDRMRPFRAYFTRSGFQVVDCPPLTTSGKNSADIVMTLDIADTIEHRTRFDEFVILSSDADFTPVALRLRAYDRITSILANQQTAAAFRSCCDVVLNMGDFEPVVDDGSEPAASAGAPVQEARDRARASTHADVGFDAIRADIKTAIDEELAAAPEPVVIDSLAMRIQQRWPVVRESDWLGTGGFKNFLREVVDGNVRLSLTPPIRESIGLTVPVAGAVWRHQSPAWAWSENQFSRLTRSRSLPPGLKYAACRAGSATADPVRGLRATRAGRKRSEKLPKPRISIRPPSARHAVICSSTVCTASATSPSPRWDCLRAIRSISSDFVIGPLSHCRARAVGSTR